MEEKKERIQLTGAEILFTHDPMGAWIIDEGKVFVRIAKWDGSGHAKDKMFNLCEMGKGSVIPAFSWEGTNHENWRFAIVVASDEAVLSYSPKLNTRFLREKFLLNMGVTETDIEADGFNGTLAQIYKVGQVQDAGIIHKSTQIEKKVQNRQEKIIKGVFDETEESLFTDGNLLYQTVSFACRKLGAKIASWDRVFAFCKGEVTVPDISKLSGFYCRPVVLDNNWYTCDCGTILSQINGQPVACIPVGGGKYKIYDSQDGKYRKLTKTEADKVEPRAFILGRSLTEERLGAKELINHILKSVNIRDVIRIAVLSLACTIIGLLLPILNQKIYDDFIPMSDEYAVLQIGAVIVSIMIGNVFFTVVKNLYEFRISSRAGYQLQESIYHRVFRLEESFLRQCDSADTAKRLSEFGEITNTLISKILGTGVSAIWSIVYLFQMIHYYKKLIFPSILMVLVYAVLIYGISLATMKYLKQISNLEGSALGKLYQYLEGISKIRMAGAEKRAILEYSIPISEAQQAAIRNNRFSDFCDIISDAAPTVFSMIFYFLVVHGKVETTSGNYMAFNTAFGSFSGAMIMLTKDFLLYKSMKPRLARLKPIMEAEIECNDEKDIVETIKGDVEFQNVSFSYTAEGNKVLNNVSFFIHSGEYVGIVGPSGSGKSTIMKLLLGFEKPISGQILYDGKDINTIDKHSLRKKIGTALQNGRLIAGSIYENITITAVKPDMKRVNEVIDMVGLREDIDSMPMGIHTMVSENGGTLSGGQQQRILIARAIYNNPSLLLFDEATSALDNITQAMVCDSLNKMQTTRIVIAHRLSTIQSCDRILVIDNGHIVDEGNYDSLMSHDGLFYQMAIRQIAEKA